MASYEELMEKICEFYMNEPMMENYVFPKENLELNLDKWKPGCPLWITGSSGDGKSTLTTKLAKEHSAEIVTSDIVLLRMGYTKEQFNDVMTGKWNDPSLVAHGIDFHHPSPAVDYVLTHPNLPYGAKNPQTKSFNNAIIRPELLKFYYWLMVELSRNAKYRNNLYIVEGSDICLLDPDVMIDKPLIILGGSRLRSLWRRAKRDSEEKNRSIFRSLWKYISKYNTKNRNLDDNKDNFRKGVERIIDNTKSTYQRPLNLDQIRNQYGNDTARRLADDPAHLWRANTGIELIHREPSKEELDRIWRNWNLMTRAQKRLSDSKSMELFGKTNKEHYSELISEY